MMSSLDPEDVEDDEQVVKDERASRVKELDSELSSTMILIIIMK